MSAALGLERPRLSRAVHARVHVVDGATKVVLTDTRDELVAEIDAESWAVLQLADGTRDLDALALACARAGLYRSEAELVALLSELSDAGMLADGLEPPSPPPPVPPEVTPPERPLAPLPGFTLVCDGGGSCCRFYGSVAFSRREAMRAELVAGELGVMVPAERLFTPVRGAQPEDDEPRAVALVDGCCAFLEPDGRCGIHRVAGGAAKPLPCQLYPMTLVDDGEAVRVSAAPECACVFASAGRDDGAPLVPVGATTFGDLGDVGVMTLPDPVPIGPGRVASRAAFAAWSARLAAGLEGATADAVHLAAGLADAVDADGLDESELERRLADASGGSLDALEPYLAALRERARHVAEHQVSYRSASDLSRRVAGWIAEALRDADVATLAGAADDPAAERFYLRALAHGYRIAVEGRPLTDGLRDRATRILAARAMRATAAPDGERPPYPLALLEAAMRNLGLRVEV